MASRKAQKEAAKAARIAREAELAAAARRKRQTVIAGSATSVRLSKEGSTLKLKVGSIALLGRMQAPPAPTSLGPEGIPVTGAPPLADTASMASGNTVDGIGCLGQEQTLFHIQAHLTVFVNGAQRSVPYRIGITGAQVQQTPAGPFVGGGSCFYFLHTHAADGIIHIESPVQRTCTLGNFFDIWGQQLNAHQVASAKGPVNAFYSGQLYVGNPRHILLHAHVNIQLDIAGRWSRR